MVTWLCITPDRIEKSERVMRALAQGWPNARICMGSPPDDLSPFIVWGQKFLAETIIPPALKRGRPFWQIDNGFYKPARGEATGYYRFHYRQPMPVFLRDVSLRLSRTIDVEFKPWRSGGEHVLIALPRQIKGGFGSAFGIGLDGWCRTIEARVLAHTKRPIKYRPRDSGWPLEHDFRDCWALVTHSSNVAVDAVLAGIPVFVEPTSMAVPVGNLDLADLENPAMPGRKDWWNSLTCQQFTIDEMRNGTAFKYLSAVARQTDAARVAA